MLDGISDCNGIATQAGIVQPPHALLQPELRRIEVRGRLRDVGVSEHVLHVMERPARLDEP